MGKSYSRFGWQLYFARNCPRLYARIHFCQQNVLVSSQVSRATPAAEAEGAAVSTDRGFFWPGDGTNMAHFIVDNGRNIIYIEHPPYKIEVYSWEIKNLVEGTSSMVFDNPQLSPSGSAGHCYVTWGCYRPWCLTSQASPVFFVHDLGDGSKPIKLLITIWSGVHPWTSDFRVPSGWVLTHNQKMDVSLMAGNTPINSWMVYGQSENTMENPIKQWKTGKPITIHRNRRDFQWPVDGATHAFVQQPRGSLMAQLSGWPEMGGFDMVWPSKNAGF